MGLETINSNSTPDALNPKWPVGSTDGTLFGAIHLRNIKTVLKNFHNSHNAFREWVESLRNEDDTRFKEAEDTENVQHNGPLVYHSAAALIDPIPEDKWPIAKLTEKGMSRISDSFNSNAEDRCVSVKAVKEVADAIDLDIANAEEILWQKIPWVGVETNFVLPAKVLGYISLGIPVEIRFLMREFRGEEFPGLEEPDKHGWKSGFLTIEPTVWHEADPTNSRHSGEHVSPYINAQVSDPYFFLWMAKQSDDTTNNPYEMLATNSGGAMKEAYFRPAIHLQT